MWKKFQEVKDMAKDIVANVQGAKKDDDQKQDVDNDIFEQFFNQETKKIKNAVTQQSPPQKHTDEQQDLTANLITIHKSEWEKTCLRLNELEIHHQNNKKQTVAKCDAEAQAIQANANHQETQTPVLEHEDFFQKRTISITHEHQTNLNGQVFVVKKPKKLKQQDEVSDSQLEERLLTQLRSYLLNESELVEFEQMKQVMNFIERDYFKSQDEQGESEGEEQDKEEYHEQSKVQGVTHKQIEQESVDGVNECQRELQQLQERAFEEISKLKNQLADLHFKNKQLRVQQEETEESLQKAQKQREAAQHSNQDLQEKVKHYEETMLISQQRLADTLIEHEKIFDENRRLRTQFNEQKNQIEQQASAKAKFLVRVAHCIADGVEEVAKKIDQQPVGEFTEELVNRAESGQFTNAEEFCVDGQLFFRKIAEQLQEGVARIVAREGKKIEAAKEQTKRAEQEAERAREKAREIEEWKKRLADAEKDLSAKIKDFTEELKKSEAEKDVLRTRLQEKEIKSNDEKETMITILNKRCQENMEEAQTIKAENEALTDNLKLLAQELSEWQGRSQQLQERLRLSEEKGAHLNDIAHQQEMDLATYRNMDAEQKAHIAVLEQNLEELSSKLEKAEKDNRQFQGDLQNMISRLQQEVSEKALMAPKNVVRSFLIPYLEENTPYTVRVSVIESLASVLDFGEEDRQRAGLRKAITTHNENQVADSASFKRAQQQLKQSQQQSEEEEQQEEQQEEEKQQEKQFKQQNPPPSTTSTMSKFLSFLMKEEEE